MRRNGAQWNFFCIFCIFFKEMKHGSHYKFLRYVTKLTTPAYVTYLQLHSLTTASCLQRILAILLTYTCSAYINLVFHKYIQLLELISGTNLLRKGIILQKVNPR